MNSTDKLLARRTRLLGPAYRLFYERPLHLVRGEGVWLYDSDGRAYLDVYNNVAHVGHCHPRVVEAVTRQTQLLNTHTRYLHETILEYAERLTATFPEELSYAMFVCSGSEANELALRIARAATDGQGTIVTAHSYHGNTSTLAQVSTAHDWIARGLDVQAVPAPDTYRTSPDEDAAEVRRALGELRTAGIQPAAFLIDTIFSSDGIFTAPTGYLAAAVEQVRQAGGLFVADEVQPGFGRTGEHLWRFEKYGVVPDIVTLGKPMGNGQPLAAVIATSDVMERFAESTRYFNTFGGNPVSCAAGLAVLNVLEEEKLQENALRVGVYLKEGLERLRSQWDFVGDVRGQGLYFGVELVRDGATREPATEEAAVVIDDMKERGVLIGSTGPRANVLKLRPPMVFNRKNADQLLESLDAALRVGFSK